MKQTAQKQSPGTYQGSQSAFNDCLRNARESGQWEVRATDHHGRVFYSWHSSKDAAKSAAAMNRGRFPYGNRVRVVAPRVTP